MLLGLPVLGFEALNFGLISQRKNSICKNQTIVSVPLKNT
jgi:hypothetical protein